MKRSIVLSLVVWMTMSCYAFNPLTFHRANYRRHDFGLSLGVVNLSPIYDISDDFIIRARKSQLMDIDDEDYIHNLCLSGYYNYHFNDRIGIGASVGMTTMPQHSLTRYNFTYNSLKQRWLFGGTSNGQIHGRTLFFMPEARYTWFYNSGLSLYVRGGLGAYYIHHKFTYRDINDGRQHKQTQTDWRVAYQVSPIGIDFTNGPVRYFMEMGYGAEGILRCGISCKLHRIWQTDKR